MYGWSRYDLPPGPLGGRPPRGASAPAARLHRAGLTNYTGYDGTALHVHAPALRRLPRRMTVSGDLGVCRFNFVICNLDNRNDNCN